MPEPLRRGRQSGGAQPVAVHPRRVRARRPASRSIYERLLCPLDGFAETVRALRRRAAAAAATSRCRSSSRPSRWPRERTRARRARAGACNVLRFDADGWLGDNTDGAGLVRDIERNAGVAAARRARAADRRRRRRRRARSGPLLDARPRARSSSPTGRVAARRRAGRAPRQALGAVVGARAARRRRSDDCGAAFDVVVNASASSVAGAAGAGRRQRAAAAARWRST